jgi:hypothetical protein
VDIEVKDMNSEPYLKTYRLQDVLAAIQLLANYPDYDLTPGDVREKIAGNPRSASQWSEVLLEHPEFFRRSEKEGDFSLVLRRAKPKNQDRLRPVLSADELNMLVITAVNLQKQALEIQKERRWWLPIATSVFVAVAGFAGSILGPTSERISNNQRDAYTSAKPLTHKERPTVCLATRSPGSCLLKA